MKLTVNKDFYTLEIPMIGIEQVEYVKTKGRLVYIELRQVFGLTYRKIKLVLKNPVTLKVMQVEDVYKDKLVIRFN